MRLSNAVGAAVVVLLFSAHTLQAARLVSEGVTYSAQTGAYTYLYAVDNRGGTDNVVDVAVVVIPDAGFYQLAPLPHTSPVGWVFVTSVGGRPGIPPSGTFQEWYNPIGVAPGQYQSGFSFTTSYAPRTSTGLNYLLFRLPGGTIDTGEVIAPQLPPRLTSVPIPLFGRLAAGLLVLALGGAASMRLYR